MTTVLRSPAAERDLEDIWLTIAVDNPAAATRMLRAIAAKIKQLADHPRMGSRPDTDDGPIDAVEIIRVADGRRDLAILF